MELSLPLNKIQYIKWSINLAAMLKGNHTWSTTIYTWIEVGVTRSVYVKVLLEWIQFKYNMVTLFEQDNMQKTQTQNTQWKQRYRWKRYRSMTRRNVRHFPSASGRMTPNSVCLWRHRKHGDSNKCWRQRRFQPSQETGFKKMINVIDNVSSEFIS